MGRLVMKFGGTSVANIDRIRNVALHVKREVDAGHEVVVIDNLSTGFREAVAPDATFVEKDIRDAADVLTPAAGFVSPMASGPFMSWGEPGPGKWITVYANAGHAFMVVAGWRFDTSNLGTGTRWTQQMRGTAGFVARHPPGL